MTQGPDDLAGVGRATDQDTGSASGSVCVRCLVSGRVQGVFFRASTREQATALGVSGYARNLSDGAVEVMACGDRAAVDKLRDWLRVGPPQARVTSVSCEAVDPHPYSGFSTR
jgi:acylphosphatase